MKLTIFVSRLLGIALFTCGVAILVCFACDLRKSGNNVPAVLSQAQATTGYGKLPLSFEANRGQVDPRVNYLAAGQGYKLFLTSNEAVLLMRGRSAETTASATSSILRMALVGGNVAAPAAGLESLAGKVNYLLGNDPTKWHRDIPTYGKVEYKGVYPGINLVYYGNQQQLEYDFVVAPGIDPSVIKLQFNGPEQLRLDQAGDLVMTFSSGELRFRRPVAYQGGAQLKQPVTAAYKVSNDNRVSFQFGDYDRSQALIIDPILSYSTFIGGSSGEGANGIAVDNAGNAYIVGATLSTDFPITAGAFNPIFTRIFVTKLNRTGSALVYSTYFGAVTQFPLDEAVGITVDGAGQAYITGNTPSPDFPVTANAFDTTCGTDGTCNGGNADAFLSVLNAAGSDLVYSTYLGGSKRDEGGAVTLDSSGKAYITGTTFSSNLSVLNAAQPTCGGGTFAPCLDAFVARFDTTLSGVSSLLYSTYLGGNGDDRGHGIAADSSGNAYVTGETISSNFPTSPGAFDTTCGDDGLCDDINSVSPGPDAFVTKLNATGSTLLYSTYLGANGHDIGNGIAVDSRGEAYVTGLTQSTDFPVGPAAFGPRLRGIEDAFVTVMNATGRPRASTYLGSNGEDIGAAIAVDAKGNAYVTGTTDFDDFPITPDRVFDFGGGEDAFVTKLDRKLAILIYSTYLGGSQDDFATGLALSHGFTLVAGSTHSPNFPTTPGAFDRTCGTDGICNDDLNDVFVTRFMLPNTATLFAAAQLSNDFLAFSANVGNTSPPQAVALTNQSRQRPTPHQRHHGFGTPPRP